MISTLAVCLRKLLTGTRVVAVVVCLSAAIFAISAHAQTTGTIAGIVRDTTGAIVPGAKVTVTNQDSKAKRTTVSNSDGSFTVTALPAATYTAEIKAQGFESLKIGGIELHPGDHQNIAKAELKIGRVEEEVTVTANVAGVSLDSRNAAPSLQLTTSSGFRRWAAMRRNW